MFQAQLFMLFSMAVLSTTVYGSCNIGDRYGGDWDGVQDHTHRTDDSIEIEGSEVIGTLNDVTNVYKCEESDEYYMFFLLLTPDRSGYNCMGFHAMADSMVQYTVVTKNGSFEPIKVPAGVKSTLENLCANGNNYAMEAVIDIARRLD
ncbi:uncharacterized protein LOC110454851 [Mizuhopecten yessoensis]|uniref:Uncharacterized protein n=1 Tax=Mizuhopecten yessoensis TaxID=6573 RepID=A0A210QEG5_MIZYE|nr:uncharacterized protein LOC110454851 [Mizuhopecten yessoensis]OWF47088.1 hypothetical protein KP79_PYT12575 [Mizuhopecten yessoensis]